MRCAYVQCRSISESSEVMSIKKSIYITATVKRKRGGAWRTRRAALVSFFREKRIFFFFFRSFTCFFFPGLSRRDVNVLYNV